jgi:hypothetical protein
MSHLPNVFHLALPQELTGSADGLLAAQRSPATPLQRMSSHAQEVAAQLASLKQQKKEAAGHAYLEYVLDKQLKFVSDPSNTRFEELELPELIKVRVRHQCLTIDRIVALLYLRWI